MVTHGHGGNIKQLAEAAGCTEKDLLDFSANINPLGLPEWFRSLISSRISSLVHYPDTTCSMLVQTFASRYGVSAEEVLIGNGSTELLYLLPRAAPRSRAVIPVPSYLDYRKVCELAGLTVETVLLREDNGFRLDLSALDLKLHGDELVIVGQPNNPTGLLVDPKAFRALAFNHPSTVFIVDEAFADFIDGLDSLIHDRPPNVVVLYSLTKFHAIPGLRLGCAVADRNIARQVRRIMPPWTVNTLAQAVGEAALQDNAYAVRTRTLVRTLREQLSIELRSIPNLTVYPGEANFLLVRIDREDLDVPTLARKMLGDGIAIRNCGNFEGLDGRFFRVAVRTAEENALLCKSIRKALGISRGTPKSLRKSPVNQGYLMNEKDMKPKPTPLMHSFYTSPMSGEEIEAESLRTIDREAPAHRFPAEEWQVVRRMIHTTADFNLIEAVRFSPDAIAAAVEALRAGDPLYVDSNMIRSGISVPRLQSVCPSYGPESIACHVADGEVARDALKTGMPRSIFAVRKAKPILDGAIVLFGNAPIGLIELNRMIIEENIRPALVVAMPVGFVHVVESKQELMSLGVPFIALAGRRGGSTLAVSVVHALCSVAAALEQDRSEGPAEDRYRNRGKNMAENSRDQERGRAECPRETIILLGHGSRVPDAGRDMEQVARGLQKKYGYPMVEICFMSRLGPHFPEVLEKCVNEGAESVVVIPYFLHMGLHILLDIPEMLQEHALRYPNVKLTFGRGFGFDDLLVDIIHRRVQEARELGDVRDLVLPPKEKYPIPHGQCEFVPMPPEEAAKYRG